MKLFQFGRRGMLGALALFCGADAFGGKFFDDAEKRCLLRDDATLPDGTQKYGFTWHRFPDQTKAPRGTPANDGWYKLVGQGTTSYWYDENHNNQKDEGEVRPATFWLYLRTRVDQLSKDSGRVEIAPDSVLADAMRGQPAARRVSGLMSDEPAIVVGRQCFAAGAGLELWVDTDAYLVVAIEPSGRFETYGSVWLTSKRDDPQYTVAHFTQPAEIDDRVRALYAGPCGKASNDAALAMVRAWNAEVGARVGDGPGFKGYYPADTSAYLPQREDIAGDFVWTVSSDYGSRGVDLRSAGGGVTASVGLRSHPELWETADEPIQRAKKTYADETKGMDSLSLPGVDEACQKTNSTYQYLICFRRLNVVGVIQAHSAGSAFTLAKPTALVRRLADVVVAKLRGQSAPPSPDTPPARFTVEAKRLGDSTEWLEYGESSRSIELQVLDADRDPVPYAWIEISVADAALGACAFNQVMVRSDGKASVRYRVQRPGINRLLFATAAGKSEFSLTTGGILFDARPQPSAQNGEWEIRTKVVDAVALAPMRDVPLRLNVDDSKLPARGKILSGEKSVKTGPDGEAVFTYAPPRQQGGVTSGSVTFTAGVEEGGYPFRFSGQTKTIVTLPPPAEK